MLAEIKSEKALSKKVCSETSFQRSNDTKKDSQKHQSDFNLNLKTPDKKFSKSLSDLCKAGHYESSPVRRSDGFGLPEKDTSNLFKVSIFNEYNNSNRIAGRRILTLLILNAWRHRRAEHLSAREEIQSLNNKKVRNPCVGRVFLRCLPHDDDLDKVHGRKFLKWLKDYTSNGLVLVDTISSIICLAQAKDTLSNTPAPDLFFERSSVPNELITDADLEPRVEGFEMQVYVLRQLLNSEKKRLEEANSSINDLMRKIKDADVEKAGVLKRNDELKGEFAKLLEHCSQIENALRNQENDIITSKLEAENWEKQLKKEREKLKKMESEEIFLKEKIQLSEKVNLFKSLQIEKLLESNKELQEKLEAQILLWDETVTQVDASNAKLKESEDVRNKLKKHLEEKDKEVRELKANIAELEKRLQEEDEKNGLLGKSILEKTNELSAVQKKLLELTKNSYPWSGGIIKVASLCAKIPVACICTVGSLLLPFPSYRL